MSTLTVATVKSNSSSPPAFQNTSGTEIGRLCRAFVNFDGTGTVTIRAQYNVSSITDNGVGDYTVNFASALTDANYSVAGAGARGAGQNTIAIAIEGQGNMAAGSCRIMSGMDNYNHTDVAAVTVAIFR